MLLDEALGDADLAESEVDEFDEPLAVDEDVVGLQVAVDHVQLLVEITQRQHQLREIHARHLLAEIAHVLEQREEVAAVHELHDDEEVVLALEGVVELGHERIIRMCHDAALRLHVLSLVLPQQVLLVHHFHREQIARRDLPREIHASIGPLADRLQQLEVLDAHRAATGRLSVRFSVFPLARPVAEDLWERETRQLRRFPARSAPSAPRSGPARVARTALAACSPRATSPGRAATRRSSAASPARWLERVSMRCVSAAAAAAAAGPFTPISAREYRVTTRVARFNRLGRSFTPYLAPLCTPRMRERSSGKRSVASRRWRAGPREVSGGSLPADRRSWREASFYVERGISGHCMHCSLWRGISSLGIRRSQMRHSSLPSRPSPERDALLLWRS